MTRVIDNQKNLVAIISVDPIQDDAVQLANRIIGRDSELRHVESVIVVKHRVDGVNLGSDTEIIMLPLYQQSVDTVVVGRIPTSLVRHSRGFLHRNKQNSMSEDPGQQNSVITNLAECVEQLSKFVLLFLLLSLKMTDVCRRRRGYMRRYRSV